MQTTTLDNAEAPDSAFPALLRPDVYRALGAAKGYRTVVALAALHGISRQQLFKLLAGAASPSLPLAMQMARDLETTVEVLIEFGRRRGPRPATYRRPKRSR